MPEESMNAKSQHTFSCMHVRSVRALFAARHVGNAGLWTCTWRAHVTIWVVLREGRTKPMACTPTTPCPCARWLNEGGPE